MRDTSMREKKFQEAQNDLKSLFDLWEKVNESITFLQGDYDRELIKEPEVIVNAMSDYVNNYGFEPHKFVELMSRQHRSLQQSFTRLVLMWLLHLSQLEEGYYDGRNEVAVNIAKKIMKGLDKHDVNLPLI